MKTIKKTILTIDTFNKGTHTVEVNANENSTNFKSFEDLKNIFWTAGNAEYFANDKCEKSRNNDDFKMWNEKRIIAKKIKENAAKIARQYYKKSVLR